MPDPDTGSLREDVRSLVAATFAAAQSTPTTPALQALVREAARDSHLADLMRAFTAARRTALREILARGRQRGELPDHADLDLITDQIYGLFWGYRFLLGHAPLDPETADRLTDSVLQGRPNRPTDGR
ncbi:TetR-like C-terminal domain-containing protein [Streptomyces triculaminicus]|uniref:TetR-like C-terminal domain-containing protein n=1 Tax=Streptomyces triculaminicus TaxID=2816232 RepID=UPI0027DBFBD4|nr:TetR-like C-terminal domain-containing protein [Streptomyces triculaminicus]